MRGSFRGNSSNRDTWVYDRDQETVLSKAREFLARYDALQDAGDLSFPGTLKWSRDLKAKFRRGDSTKYDATMVRKACWRPFSTRYLYTEKLLNDVLTENHTAIFGAQLDKENKVIMVMSHAQAPFMVHAVARITDAGYGSRATNNLPLFRYDDSGNREFNITDWGRNRIRKHYRTTKISKEDIFYYVYGVLHDPLFCRNFAETLRVEFPRLPLYSDFRKWRDWGKALMDLHLNYESQALYPLDVQTDKEKSEPRIRLRAKRNEGVIEVDDATRLTGVPPEAWQYKLGPRSALEWVLDQFKEKKIRDESLPQVLNTYRFQHYKQEAIDLLCRVCTVSVKSVAILHDMEQHTDGRWE